MKKLFYFFAIFGMMTVAFSGCSSDEDDNNLAPAGTLAPPAWLIGTWSSGTGLLDNIIVTPEDFIIGHVGLPSFKDLTALDSFVSQALGNGTVQVREMRKTDTEYQVGQETRRTSAAPPSTRESHRFRIGDGTFIEHAEYSRETARWGEWRRFDKVE